MTKLSTKDLKQLSQLVKQGRALERDWIEATHSERSTLLTAFLVTVKALAAHENTLLSKLAELAPRFSEAMTAQHLATMLVPFERLLGRGVRDDEFLFDERDRKLKQHRNTGRIVVCENIRSAFNVGSIFRTAECFGFEAAWLTGYTVTPASEQLQSTAMGTTNELSWQHFANTRDAMTAARDQGYSIIALETGNEAVPVEHFVWPARFILLVGNERFGLDSETREAADHCVRLPAHGSKNSLNVGVAFGAACMAIEQSQPLHTSHGSQPPSQPLAAPIVQPPAAPTMAPIGFAKTELYEKQVAPRQGSYRSEVARIELLAKWRDKPSLFDQALKDLEGFERIWILFEFSQTDHFKPMVSPPRGDGTKRGVFATRSPHRPNRIGLTSARLLRVKGLTIEIAEHDLLDGTPVLDIKPYVPEADAFPEARAGWLTSALDSSFRLEESSEFSIQVEWLEAEGETRLRPFVREQLEFDPTNRDRKRVHRVNAELWEIAFRTWRLQFVLNLESRLIRLDSLHSGYTATDLENIDNPYGDKAIHRAFNRRFARNENHN